MLLPSIVEALNLHSPVYFVGMGLTLFPKFAFAVVNISFVQNFGVREMLMQIKSFSPHKFLVTVNV